jgi:hypothetical protein
VGNSGQGRGSLREVNVTTLDPAVARLEGEHAQAPRWFRDHAGQTVGWREIKDHADQGRRSRDSGEGMTSFSSSGSIVADLSRSIADWANDRMIFVDEGV